MDQRKLANKYTGNVAVDYDKNRIHGEKWAIEQTIIQGLLEKLPNTGKVLDIPVGTGRFLSLYQKFGFDATGMDISVDMLKEAHSKAKALAYNDVHFLQSDIFNIKAEDNEFSIVLCMRFLNWIDSDRLQSAVKELVRVSGHTVILGIRHLTPLADVKPWRSLTGFFIFVRRCFGSYEGDRELVFHKKDKVMKIFENLDVSIRESVCVEARNDGTEYYIYRIVKK